MKHRLKKIGLGGAGIGRAEQFAAAKAGEPPPHIARQEAREQVGRFADRQPSNSSPSSSSSRAGGSDEGANDGIPMYRPPKLGAMSYAASYSYLETLDLVSDGPIEGLVNQNGVVVKDKALLQGIYLDGTPVGTTVNPYNERVDKVDESE